MNYRSILFCTVALAATVVAVSNCKDDDNNDSADAGEDVDLSFPDIPIIDQGNVPSKNNANFLFFEVKDQRPDKAKGKVFPVTVVQLAAKQPPSRAPDAVQDPPISLEGLGCVAYKFTTSNPVAPQGPHFIDGNMGDVQVSGFSGAGAPKAPITFRRIDITAPPPGSDAHGGGAGMFKYVTMDMQPFPGDPSQPNLAFSYMPVNEHFLTPGDFIKVKATGGADMPAFPEKSVPTAPIGTFNVTTNLWTISPAQVDGTQDFKVDYTCDGGPCDKSAAGIAVQFISTDAPLPDSDPSDPLADYQFPYPRQNFGMVICQGLFTQAPSSFIVQKQVLAVLGNSWTKLYTQVSPINISFGASSNNDRLTVGAGVGYFGFNIRK